MSRDDGNFASRAVATLGAKLKVSPTLVRPGGSGYIGSGLLVRSFALASSTYRLKDSLLAIAEQEDKILLELPAGAMFYSTNPRPDSQGLIQGMCKGQMVQIFACDREERAEPLARVVSRDANSTDRLRSAATVIFAAAQPAEIDDDGD